MKAADWSWNMKRAGIVFQMPDSGRISVQEGKDPDPKLRALIEETCKAFFTKYPETEK